MDYSADVLNTVVKTESFFKMESDVRTLKMGVRALSHSMTVA